MGPARPRPPPAPRLLLRLLLFLLPRPLWGDVVFVPSFIQMSGTSATASLVGDTQGVRVTLEVWNDELGIFPITDCGLQNNGTGNWSLMVTPGVRVSEVTIRLSSDLQSCTSETEFISEFPCIVETLLVTASNDSSCLAHLLLQVEIYPNTTSQARNASDNVTVVPNQMYQPFGPCPCDLVVGACDIQCCCDQDCTSNLTDLFREACFPGVFGGHVNLPFDQLCSAQTENQESDWFPFMCVQSSLDNTPFLGYFYHGSVSPKKGTGIRAPVPAPVEDWSDFGYVQGSPIMTAEGDYLTIPQVSTVGQCLTKAPVAFLKNFDVRCIIDVASYQERLDIRNVRIKNGSMGGIVTPEVSYEESDAFDKVLSGSEILSNLGPLSLKTVSLEEHYTFRWNNRTITEVHVRIIKAQIHADQQGMLTQRFKVIFLSSNSRNGKRWSGNPGYHSGKPVRVLNASGESGVAALQLWQPVGRGLCREINTFTPVLFGEDAVSGCLLEVSMNENCTQLRAEVTEKLNSLVQATHVAQKGNSEYKNISDGWLKIIRRDAPVPEDDPHYRNIKGICPGVPAVMTIHFLISNSGNLEGLSQDLILGMEVRFSSVTWQFQCGISCEDKPSLFPISASVRFIRIPPQPSQPPTSFQVKATAHDCTKNEVCWSELAYPLTESYQGEPYSSCVAKSLMLAFFLTVILILSSPWSSLVQARGLVSL